MDYNLEEKKPLIHQRNTLRRLACLDLPTNGTIVYRYSMKGSACRMHGKGPFTPQLLKLKCKC